jgi:hypothetical protein
MKKHRSPGREQSLRGASSLAKKTPAASPEDARKRKDAPAPENKVISLGVASSKIAAPKQLAKALRISAEQVEWLAVCS